MIHPTALISPQAEIPHDVEIGAYVIIEGPVTLAPGCRILPAAQLLGRITIGENCVIGRAAVIGETPQDLKFDPTTDSSVEIGARNTLREHTTIHRGAKHGSVTRLGHDNFLMAGAHIGHDCQIGHHNVIANAALLAGHVTMGDHNFIGGSAVFHQFSRVGDFCMVQGNAGFSKDLAPYVVGFGVNRINGLNIIGLKRAGFTAEQRSEIKEIFKITLHSPLNFHQALELTSTRSWGQGASRFLDFIRAPSAKGICRRSD